MTEHAKPRVYLAGPMVFYENRDEVFAEMKAICSDEGLHGVAPPDGQTALHGLAPGKPLYKGILKVDFDLCDDADGAIICLDPYNGRVEMDTGTAVEIGYLFARGKKMSGWTTESKTVGDRIRELSGGETRMSAPAASGAMSGNKRDKDGLLVHSDGLSGHVMSQMALEVSGGEVFIDSDWKTAFRQSARNLAKLLANRSEA